MKKIYCIEQLFIETKDNLPINYIDLNSKYYLSSLPLPVFGYSYVTEYDDEEKFKSDLLNKMDGTCVISRVFTKEVPDDYQQPCSIVTRMS